MQAWGKVQGKTSRIRKRFSKEKREKVLKYSLIGSSAVVGITGLLLLSQYYTGEFYINKAENIEDYLASEPKYVEVLNYTNYKLGDTNICFTARYKREPLMLNVINSRDTDRDNVRNIINFINEFEYNELQNDPTLLDEFGGNCQAKSLLARDYFNELGLENNIVYTEDHMYNRVKIDKDYYKIDLTYNTMTKEEVNE